VLERTVSGLPDPDCDRLRNEIRGLVPPPGDVPDLGGRLDVAWASTPLNGIIGGDHLLFVDFRKRFDLEARLEEAERLGRHEVAANLRRNQQRAGVLVADVAGHEATDGMIAAMLHHAFLVGANYELDMFGEITTNLFEHLKTRFYEATTITKYFTMIYGEFSEGGRFRFLSSGHPFPVIWSRRYGARVEISRDRFVSYTPMGMFPSSVGVDERRRYRNDYREQYTVNEINLLGEGDVLLLYTDGLSEHGEGRFFRERLDGCLERAEDGGARAVVDAIRDALPEYGPPEDDLTYVVLRRA
jgi:serine phosphatase RsbU (regulator of sigma subunit)